MLIKINYTNILLINQEQQKYITEDILDRKIACSHLRAWELFVASLQSQREECKFIAWPCNQGADAFTRGTCFPHENTKWSQEMGYTADHGPLGIYYLATRPNKQYCGTILIN